MKSISELLQQRKTLLFVLAIGNAIAFSTWTVLLNNYVVERASFTGEEIGILQSLREVPGFLAFTAVWVLLLIRQQRFAILSLATLGIGIAITTWYPSALWLYFSTVFMSIGFHYLETLQTSLNLQWLEKSEAPHVLGQILSARSFSSMLVLAALYGYFRFFEANYTVIYLLVGGAAIAIAIFCWKAFPQFPDKVVQRKELFLRKKYWLYYCLIFLSGARRQIFVVFAAFLLVEKFSFPIENMVLLTLVSSALITWLSPKLGKLIGVIGERRALALEQTGLIIIFTSYAFVNSLAVAVGLYILDQLLFVMVIAISTYFQKIADPADIGSTAGVAFTINHIAAVLLPALLGILWVINYSAVFIVGALIASCSLLISRMIPDAPMPGMETRLLTPRK